MEDQWVKQQQMNELPAWKQKEYLELLSWTQMHKSVLYHWQDLLKKQTTTTKQSYCDY